MTRIRESYQEFKQLLHEGEVIGVERYCAGQRLSKQECFELLSLLKYDADIKRTYKQIGERVETCFFFEKEIDSPTSLDAVSSNDGIFST